MIWVQTFSVVWAACWGSARWINIITHIYSFSHVMSNVSLWFSLTSGTFNINTSHGSFYNTPMDLVLNFSRPFLSEILFLSRHSYFFLLSYTIQNHNIDWSVRCVCLCVNWKMTLVWVTVNLLRPFINLLCWFINMIPVCVSDLTLVTKKTAAYCPVIHIYIDMHWIHSTMSDALFESG